MKYEIFIWLKPDLTADEHKKEIKQLKELLPQVEVEDLGKRKLAYVVKGLTEGHELHLKFEAETAAIGEITASLNRRTNVLRYLLTKSL
ncbi:MAG: 30S ribosomal protein S6 [Patescibacteria group bacterium]|nr:30S ribosomal protein S6 [Patescibacteria group bacterium]